ncbi:MAG TPA: hypothetical protein VFC18_14415 [Burkholderiales bacterium]|nr:hypothetical protein [Burkholderiales bacterium]
MAFAFLLLAASAVLAQPVCAASEPLTVSPQDCNGSHDDPHGEPCCADLEAIVSTVPDLIGSSGLPPLFVATWWPAPRTAAPRAASAGRLTLLSPPPPLPYHARSARILR